jgi:hypothetical protein
MMAEEQNEEQRRKHKYITTSPPVLSKLVVHALASSAAPQTASLANQLLDGRNRLSPNQSLNAAVL